jgi:hypothetical protein
MDPEPRANGEDRALQRPVFATFWTPVPIPSQPRKYES